MAGFWADAPGRRMAWHINGTVAYTRAVSDGTIEPIELDQGNRDALNAENQTLLTPLPTNDDLAYLVWIFPELRDLVGFYEQGWRTGNNAATAGLVEGSVDTTNGFDGTWQTVIADYSTINDGIRPKDNVLEHFRDSTLIAQGAAINNGAGLRGLRATIQMGGTSGNPAAAHLYGAIAASAVTFDDRLVFIDIDAAAIYGNVVDYGDRPRGSVRDRTVRVQNNSNLGLGLTARNVQLSFAALSPSGGPSNTWFTFEDPGSPGSFLSSLNLGDIAPGSSFDIVIRQNIPDAAILAPHSAYIVAEALGGFTV